MKKTFLILVMTLVLPSVCFSGVSLNPSNTGAGGGGSSWVESSDCSSVTTLGSGCYDTDANTLCIGNGSACVQAITSYSTEIAIPVTPHWASLTTGDDQNCITIPRAGDLVAVSAAIGTASSSGTPTFQVHRVRSGVAADMLSTAITIDAYELTSTTASTAAVIDAAHDDLVAGDIVCVDVDLAGTGSKGLASVILTVQ